MRRPRPSPVRIARILVAVVFGFLFTGAGFGDPPPYHEPQPAQVNSLEAQSWTVLDETLGQGTYGRDGGLVWAARDLCTYIAASDSPTAGSELVLDMKMVRDSLLGRGITETQVLPFAVSATTEDLVISSFTGYVENKGAQYQGRTVGLGSVNSSSRQMLCALAVKRSVDLKPCPRVVEVPGEVELGGEIVADLGSIEVVMATPAGDVLDVPVVIGGLEFSATLPLVHGEGVYMVEVLGDAGFGPEVLNLFPVTLGQGGGVAEVVLSVPWREGPSRNAWMLFDLVNAHRAEHHLAPLEPDHELALVALAHCKDMRDGGYFGHVSPTRGDLQDRTDHLEHVTDVAEAIALASSPQRAFSNLVSSPAHAAALRSPQMTHMGVGKVKTGDGMLFTVVVARR